MSSSQGAAHHAPRRLGSAAGAAGRGVLQLLRRIYAVVLIAVIVWLTFSALRYLFSSLFSPLQTPAQIAGVPRRLDESLLSGGRPDWLGLQSVENPRGPLAHFHRFDTWIESDRFNDCTRSGCHATLPHNRSKELRAFLNMHATTLQCGVCHMKSDAEPLPVTWYSLDNGKPTGVPAALRTIAWLDAHPEPVIDATGQRQLVDLLRAAAAEAQGDEQLIRLARQVEGVRPATPALARFAAQARDAVARVFHGSYGAKMALRGSDGAPIFGHPNTKAAVQDWLSNAGTAAGPTRDALLAAVHPTRREKPLMCDNCHTATGARIDFAGMGYPASRIRLLSTAPIFDMIRHIGEGRAFHLPSLGGSEAPASQPVKP